MDWFDVLISDLGFGKSHWPKLDIWIRIILANKDFWEGGGGI